MLLSFKWTVSKGRDTYGYNIVTLSVNGEKASRCDGGNYDMNGTCLAMWMQERFKEELLKFKYDEKGNSDFYGLTFYNGKPHLNGACGWESMEHVLKELGYYLENVNYKNSLQEYILHKVE